MAESIITELFKDLVKKLGSVAYKKLVFVKDLDSYIKGSQELKSTVEASLLDASHLESCTEAQQDVFDKLRAALEELNDFLYEHEERRERKEVMRGNKFIKDVRLFFSESNQVFDTCRHAHKLKAIMEKFHSIARNHDLFGKLTGVPSANQKTACSHVLSNLVVGRDEDRDNIVSVLSESSTASEQLSVHAIVGMGGLGKTTLAWYVYNDKRLESCFDVKFWVSTGPNFDFTKVLESMIPYYGTYGREEKPLSCNTVQLYDHFRGAILGKKFLLVLDNICDQDELRIDWVRLRKLLEFGANGSQVLITTRNEKAAKLMGSVNPYKLGELRENYSWDLFQMIAFTPWQEPGVEAIGREIAERCPKLPLAIESIAGHLAEKCTIKEWQAFRDDQLANIKSYGGKIIPTLKLSYDTLDEELKPCVRYFALLPKGFEVDRDEVIHHWMALGYIKRHNKNQTLEDVGEEYLSSLLNRSFLRVEPREWYGLEWKSYNMHDLMHDLVVWVAGFNYKMADLKTREFDERVRHLSILIEPTQHLDWYVPPSICKLKSLQSFLLPSQKSYLEPSPRLRVSPCSLGQRFGIRSRFLRVLDLHNLGIKELPRSLGDLACLRYINLSKNPIRKLPSSFKYLENLLVLDMSCCEELQELPKGIKSLKSLRHLKLKGCKELTSMPMGLGKLTDLQTLSVFVAGGQSSLGGGKQIVSCLAELEYLNDLKDELTIRVVGRSENTAAEAEEAKLWMKKNIKWIVVEFKDSTKDDEMVLTNLRPNDNVTRLTIRGYAGERFPSWMMNLHLWLPNLRFICLSGCKGCKYLCSFGRLPHLGWLTLSFLEDVEYIEETTASSNGSGDISKCEPMFPRLDSLFIKGMPKLKGWRRPLSSEDQDDNRQLSQALALAQGQHQLPNPHKLYCELLDSELEPNVELEGLLKVFQEFSSPKSLTCFDCKNLEAIPEMIGNLTSLEELWVSGCNKLKYLPHQISNLTNLKKLTLTGCSEELKHRCSEQGEYWPYIKHIPHRVYFCCNIVDDMFIIFATAHL